MNLYKNIVCLIIFASTISISLNAKDLTNIFPLGRTIACEGIYRDHVQGLDTDGESIYWSFASTIVKTDFNGKLLKKEYVEYHHGDPCFVDDYIYFPLGAGSWNKELAKGDKSLNYVMCYDTELNLVKEYHVPEVVYGAGCIAYANDKFYVSGGLPVGAKTIYIYEYSKDFKFIRRHELITSNNIGIQTMKFAYGDFWLGIYNKPNICVRCDKNFKIKNIYKYPTTVGIMNLEAKGTQKFLVPWHIQDTQTGRNKARAVSMELRGDNLTFKK